MKLASLCCVLVSACDTGDVPVYPGPEGPTAGSTWPADTVLAVNEVPILGADVDAVCRDVSELNPAWTRPHQRRLALTNLFLPRAAARSRHRAAREKARAACAAEFERIQRGAQPTETVQVHSGTHSDVGLDFWSYARGRELHAWSAPIEVVGRWVLLRLEQADAARRVLTFSVIVFRYLPGAEDKDPTPALEAAWEASRLIFVDPTWAQFVPQEWQFKQQASRP